MEVCVIKCASDDISLEDFMRDKADRWSGPSEEFTEVDDHHAQSSDLPEFGKDLLQFWGFDDNCTCS